MADAKIAPPVRRMSFWEQRPPGVLARQSYLLLPGLLLTGLLAWVSILVSEYIGTRILGFEKNPISPVMVAILLGMCISNALRLPAWLKPGLTFSVKKVLRLGIILLGIRLSVFDVFRLGALGVPVVAVCILGALFFTTRLNNWLKLPERLGTLIAVGTSICGVSAIVATAPGIEADDEEVAYAVAVITIFGLVAMLLYPYVANSIFDGDPVKAGLFMGTSIHETAQVTGAGLVFADVFSLPRGLDVATVTKLVRNVFMALVIPLMAVFHARRISAREGSVETQVSFARLFPLFIVGFLAFAVVRSLGDAGIQAGGQAFGMWDGAAWKEVYGLVQEWAVNLMVVAIAGVGLNTRFGLLKGLGLKPFIVGLGAALMVGIVSLVTIWVLGTFVTL